jgi:hypothetical protein
MSEVKRFTHGECSGHYYMEEIDSGEYVLHSDYEELQQELLLQKEYNQALSEVSSERDALREELKPLETPPHDPRFPELDKAHLIKICIKQNIELESLREDWRKAMEQDPDCLIGTNIYGDKFRLDVGISDDSMKSAKAYPVYASPVPAQKESQPKLTVWYGSMPESNGKSNWTAMVHREGESVFEGITLSRSEYPDRVRYDADCFRYIIGELAEKPCILDYDSDKCDSPNQEPKP